MTFDLFSAKLLLSHKIYGMDYFPWRCFFIIRRTFMEVKQVYVTRENPGKIFSIIEDELLEQINTQIYVKNEIYLAMSKNGYNYHVFSKNYTKGYHYYHTNDENGYFGGEKWLELSEGCAFDKEIARASFISNNNEYMQIVDFNSSKIPNYKHYLVGFQKLLLIQFEPKSN